jgi:hypothetical protein
MGKKGFLRSYHYVCGGRRERQGAVSFAHLRFDSSRERRLMMRVNDILLSWAVFTWVLLLFFGTLDIAGFITDGHWYRLVVIAVIVGSISGIYLIMKRRPER